MKPNRFTLENIRGVGKEAFACAMDQRCINRCPFLIAKKKCETAKGVCESGCDGWVDVNDETDIYD